MKIIFSNLKKVLKNTTSLMVVFFVLCIFISIFYTYSNYKLSFGNLGTTLAINQIFLEVSISLLGAIFFGASVYKIKFFGKINKKQIGSGSIGSFFGILVGGCPACSITLASYLGLSSFLSLLPYNGLELKILGFILLLIANYFTLRDLETCLIHKK